MRHEYGVQVRRPDGSTSEHYFITADDAARWIVAKLATRDSSQYTIWALNP